MQELFYHKSGLQLQYGDENLPKNDQGYILQTEDDFVDTWKAMEKMVEKGNGFLAILLIFKHFSPCRSGQIHWNLQHEHSANKENFKLMQNTTSSTSD